MFSNQFLNKSVLLVTVTTFIIFLESVSSSPGWGPGSPGPPGPQPGINVKGGNGFNGNRGGESGALPGNGGTRPFPGSENGGPRTGGWGPGGAATDAENFRPENQGYVSSGCGPESFHPCGGPQPGIKVKGGSGFNGNRGAEFGALPGNGGTRPFPGSENGRPRPFPGPENGGPRPFPGSENGGPRPFPGPENGGGRTGGWGPGGAATDAENFRPENQGYGSSGCGPGSVLPCGGPHRELNAGGGNQKFGFFDAGEQYESNVQQPRGWNSGSGNRQSGENSHRQSSNWESGHSQETNGFNSGHEQSTGQPNVGKQHLSNRGVGNVAGGWNSGNQNGFSSGGANGAGWRPGSEQIARNSGPGPINLIPGGCCGGAQKTGPAGGWGSNSPGWSRGN